MKTDTPEINGREKHPCDPYYTMYHKLMAEMSDTVERLINVQLQAEDVYITYGEDGETIVEDDK